MTGPIPMSEIAAIAAKLTKAQRRWLLAAEPTLDKVNKEPCAKWWDSPRRLYVPIGEKDFWLASRGMTSPAGSPRFTEGYEKLTPLGLQVRALLKEQPNG